MNRVLGIWWNLQRFFHYTPSSIGAELGLAATSGWGPEAYEAKVRNVAAVLEHLSAGVEIGLVGFGEVENSHVVSDLLQAADWTHLVEATGDNTLLEGYDVTLLYNPRWFQLAAPVRSHNVHLRFKTRDIFEVHLRASDSAEILVLVHHWPSRLVSTAHAQRIGLADYAARLVEQWLKYPLSELWHDGKFELPDRDRLESRWNRSALMMGDFNDEPFDVSISEVLLGERDPRLLRSKLGRADSRSPVTLEQYLGVKPRLYNPCWELLVPSVSNPGGTIFWNGRWYLLDQILVSHSMLQGNGIRLAGNSVRIAFPPSAKSADGSRLMLCTESGKPWEFNPKTLQGTSDHLPLLFELEVPGTMVDVAC